MDTQAFLRHHHTLDRAAFIPEPFKFEALVNAPLPIGYGQTISQPSLVAEMSILLDPLPSSRVLEIGTGSGYQTALLAPFSQTVYTVERITELALQAQLRFKTLGYTNIKSRIADGSLGWPEEAPFDRIIVTAASEIPPPLLKQLANNGRMLIPVGEPYTQRLILVEKDKLGKITMTDAGGVVFVELVGQYGWGRHG